MNFNGWVFFKKSENCCDVDVCKFSWFRGEEEDCVVLFVDEWRWFEWFVWCLLQLDDSQEGDEEGNSV